VKKNEGSCCYKGDEGGIRIKKPHLCSDRKVGGGGGGGGTRRKREGWGNFAKKKDQDRGKRKRIERNEGFSRKSGEGPGKKKKSRKLNN